MITIQNLKVMYRDFCALDIPKTLTIEKGDRVGIIGANGAGKTTFLKACLGLVPSTGTIAIDTQDIAVHMQENNYVDTMAIQHIMETILKTRIADNPKLQELIAFLNFESSLKKKFEQLSGGQKQRFTLIMVLMQDAPLTFFDEVTTALDFETRQALMNKIREWYDGHDATLLFVTHYYEELENLTNKLLILHQGSVVDYGSHTELFQKYCGHSALIVSSQTTLKLDNLKILNAPQNMIAIACETPEQEVELSTKLIHENINYRRTNSDIELMTINALALQGEQLCNS